MNEAKAERPVEILQRLIRFDTTNPPGNERPCVEYIAGLLEAAGLETEKYGASAERPNLVARLPGRGEAPPLLMYGHVDVVTTAHQSWAHAPFGGELIDGYVWGRGALDMKGGLAMMASALIRARRERLQPAGDILFAVVVDEEAGGGEGARFLVERRPDLFQGVRHALGEFGGFPLRLAGRRFYMIQVAEKQSCWLEATIRRPGGHGARPMRGGAMATLGRILRALDRRRTPIHVTPVTRRTIEALARNVPLTTRVALRLLLLPRLTDRILRLLGPAGRSFEALFRHTVNATIVRSGATRNVVPSEVVLGLDARILPGFGPDDLLDELNDLLGGEADLRVLLHDQAPSDPDYGLLDGLGEILRELDPKAIPVPFLLPASTDARFFSRLGIQTYGFTPMRLPERFDFFATIHAADERIPVDALEFGTEAMYRVIGRYGALARRTGRGDGGSARARARRRR